MVNVSRRGNMYAGQQRQPLVRGVALGGQTVQCSIPNFTQCKHFMIDIEEVNNYEMWLLTQQLPTKTVPYTDDSVPDCNKPLLAAVGGRVDP